MTAVDRAQGGVGGTSAAAPVSFRAAAVAHRLTPMRPAAEHNPTAPGASMPPGTPAWVKPGLLQRTRDVWGRRAGIPISADEALAILLRTGTLLDVLSRS